MTVQKIISGGQTGVDQVAILAARALGIPTGGTAAKGWSTEDGPAPWLEDYGLEECDRAGYPARTIENVRKSSATVIFGDPESSGSRLTINACLRHNRPYAVNPNGIVLRAWCDMLDVAVLNVAGNRASVNPEIMGTVLAVIKEAFGDFNNNPTTDPAHSLDCE